MSILLAVTLPITTAWGKVAPVLSKYRIELTKLENLKSDQLPEDRLFLRACIEGNDSNNTCIGLISAYLSMLEENRREIPMYTYNGWSGALKDSWTDKCIDRLKNLSILQETELAVWISFIKEMLSVGNVGNLGLIRHCYSQESVSEIFTLKKHQVVNLKDVCSDTLLYI